MGITFYFKKRTTTTRPVISTLLPLPLHSGASRGVAGGILALSLPLVLAAACHLHPLPLLQARQPVSPGRELLRAPGALVSASVDQWLPPDRLALEARVPLPYSWVP